MAIYQFDYTHEPEHSVVSVSEMKHRLRIEFADDDELIQNFIDESIAMSEAITNRVIAETKMTVGQIVA